MLKYIGLRMTYFSADASNTVSLFGYKTVTTASVIHFLIQVNTGGHESLLDPYIRQILMNQHIYITNDNKQQM